MQTAVALAAQQFGQWQAQKCKARIYWACSLFYCMKFNTVNDFLAQALQVGYI